MKQETMATKFMDTSNSLGKGMRRKIKRTKEQPRADIIHMSSIPKLKDEEMEEPGLKEFRAM